MSGLRYGARAVSVFIGTAVVLSLATPAVAATENDPTPRRRATYTVPITITPEGDPAARAMPSGCHLSVYIRREGRHIKGSAMTQCLTPVTMMSMRVTIQRSRWWGWESKQSSPGVTGTNTRSVTDDLIYNCGGTGTHDFRAIGSGVVLKNGTRYTAKAYEQIDEQYCG